jgi:hypothetical protein
MKCSKKIRSNPFGKQIVELLPVTQNADGRKVFFAKMPITPDTNPVDLQDLQRKQARITSLLFSAANRLAAERGILPEDARSMFFEQVDPVTGVKTTALNFIDFLTESQMEEFLILQGEAEGLPISCTTVFFQNRLAFDLPILDITPDGYKVDSLWFDVEPGDQYKIDGAVVSVVSVKDDIVKFNEGAIVHVGAVGFALNGEGDYLLGDVSWSEQQTRSMLSMDQINAIYRFYDECLNGGNSSSDDTGKQKESQTSNGLPTSTTPSLPIGGEESTPNVAHLESQLKTIDSDIEVLATVQ